jgi:formylmethanofuran dehydrogenase subunit A
MTTLRLRGGRVIDPANGCDEVRDLYLRDGRMVDLAPNEAATEEIDLGGCIVMAGGIDMHTHIGGGKVNLARMLMPEDHRANANPLALPDNVLELASCGTCTPGTLATGYRYVEMGYTAAFEPAMMACNARHTHMEMGDVPIVDHGAYVMLGNDETVPALLAERCEPQRLRDYVGWVVHATKALGVKVVNPAGISAFKFNQRKLDVDEPHVHWQVTPRQVMHALARAVHELGLAHPLHIHASNLGVAGNIAVDARDHGRAGRLPGHLTHVQFHSYGTEGPKKFSSAALALAEALDAHPNCQHRHGPGPVRPDRHRLGRHHAPARERRPRQPAQGIGADIECDSGCGVLPFRYREQSYVNALQWSIGLELFLLVRDPWRVVLTTDHPNGAPVHQLPAPDPAFDGQAVSRRAAGAAASGGGRRSRRCGRSRASCRCTRSRS